jgi:hypothetical protein
MALACMGRKLADETNASGSGRQRHWKGNLVRQAKATSAKPTATAMPIIDRMQTVPASQATSRNSDSIA